MPLRLSCLCGAAFAAAVCATPTMAQTPTAPDRNGPEWGGREHQPTAAEVEQGEARAGLGTPTEQQKRRRDEEDRLDQEILQRAQQDLARPIPPAP